MEPFYVREAPTLRYGDVYNVMDPPHSPCSRHIHQPPSSDTCLASGFLLSRAASTTSVRPNPAARPAPRASCATSHARATDLPFLLRNLDF